MEPQAQAAPGGFTNGLFSGNFFFGVILPAISDFGMNSGMLSSNRNAPPFGAFNGTLDSNTAMGLLPDQAISDTFSVSANGRITTGNGSVIIYIVSASKALLLDVTPAHSKVAAVVLEEGIEAQVIP